MFRYGEQYFKLPTRLEELIIEQTGARWPMVWTESRCRAWIREVLDQYRKIRARLMEVRNFVRIFVECLILIR